MTSLPGWLLDNTDLLPSLRFQGSDVLGPIVYLVEREGRPLYVGSSAKGLRRPLGQHHALTDLLPTDTFYVWKFPDYIAASSFETHLITRLNPSRNARGTAPGPLLEPWHEDAI